MVHPDPLIKMCDGERLIKNNIINNMNKNYLPLKRIIELRNFVTNFSVRNVGNVTHVKYMTMFSCFNIHSDHAIG